MHTIKTRRFFACSNAKGNARSQETRPWGFYSSHAKEVWEKTHWLPRETCKKQGWCSNSAPWFGPTIRPCWFGPRSSGSSLLCLWVHICIFVLTEPHGEVPVGETIASRTNEADRVGDYAPEAQVIGCYGQDENHQEFHQVGGFVSEQH